MGWSGVKKRWSEADLDALSGAVTGLYEEIIELRKWQNDHAEARVGAYDDKWIVDSITAQTRVVEDLEDSVDSLNEHIAKLDMWKIEHEYLGAHRVLTEAEDPKMPGWLGLEPEDLGVDALEEEAEAWLMGVVKEMDDLAAKRKARYHAFLTSNKAKNMATPGVNLSGTAKNKVDMSRWKITYPRPREDDQNDRIVAPGGICAPLNVVISPEITPLDVWNRIEALVEKLQPVLDLLDSWTYGARLIDCGNPLCAQLYTHERLAVKSDRGVDFVHEYMSGLEGAHPYRVERKTQLTEWEEFV